MQSFWRPCGHTLHAERHTVTSVLGTKPSEIKYFLLMNNKQFLKVWLGDFNTLTESDYSSQEWDQIVKVKNRFFI